MPTVSVLIPAYNAGQFVEQALDSVAEQSLEPTEIVAVDDGSSDETFSILRRRAATDPRIRAVRNDANLGMTGNWNRCLSLATADLVLKLDADDCLRPDALRRLVAAFNTPSVIAAGIRTLVCNEQLEPLDGLPADDAMQKAGIDPYRDHLLPAEQWYPLAAAGNQLWHSSAILYRRELLGRLQGFDERFGCASDTDMIWRILEQPGHIAHCGEVGVLYRLRSGSVSSVFRSNKWLQWEGIAGNLASLSRWRKNHSISRFLRMHYAELWHRWKSLGKNGDDEGLPAGIRQNLRSLVAEVAPPPVLDRLEWRARKALRRSTA